MNSSSSSKSRSSSSSSRNSGSEHRNFLFDHPHFPLGYAYSLVFLAAAAASAACVVVFAAAAAAGCVFSWTIYRALSHNRSVALELQFHTDSRRNSDSGSDENLSSSLRRMLSSAFVVIMKPRTRRRPFSFCMGLRVSVRTDQVKSEKRDAD